MSGSTSSYLLYCAAGLILSTLVTLLFEAYQPSELPLTEVLYLALCAPFCSMPLRILNNLPTGCG